jgi:ribose 5-phosphate isomerase B
MAEMITVDGLKIPVGSHEGKHIIMGSDHRGYEFKQELERHLSRKGYLVADIGTDSNERCDYTVYSDKLADIMSCNLQNSVGIGICGSGIGILIPASKRRGIYAARCATPEDAASSRQHNNSNVLGIGADCMDLETAIELVDVWLTTPFDPDAGEGAYLRRYIQTLEIEDRLFSEHLRNC